MSRVIELQMEIEQIRANCKHEQGYVVGNWSNRPGSWKPERICNNCRMNISGITEQEIKDFQTAEDDRNKTWRKENGIKEIDD